MKAKELEIRKYVQKKLFKNAELRRFVEKSSILLIENEERIVWDLLILLPDGLFLGSFVKVFGDCFVIDDHENDPWVFARFKSYKWLKNDFVFRLPIALWVFQNSLVLQDKRGTFRKIMEKQKAKFSKSVVEILRKKYIEFRSERHNLRHAIQKQRDLAQRIIKATIVKLVLEICFLAEGKPYPYKKLLSETAMKETESGKEIIKISKNFLAAENEKMTIKLSEKLVAKIIAVLADKRLFSEDFLQRWWLYLS